VGCADAAPSNLISQLLECGPLHLPQFDLLFQSLYPRLSIILLFVVCTRTILRSVLVAGGELRTTRSGTRLELALGVAAGALLGELTGEIVGRSPGDGTTA